MKTIFFISKIKNFLSRRNIKISIILIAVFFGFSSIIVFLLPPQDETKVGSEFFTNVIMIFPISIAIILILLSFRRSLNKDIDLGYGIRFKIALALITVAVLSILPIIIISSNIIHKTINELFTQRTEAALKASIVIANEWIIQREENLIGQLEQLRFDLMNNFIDLTNLSNSIYSRRFTYASTHVLIVHIENKAPMTNAVKTIFTTENKTQIVKGITAFLEMIPISNRVQCSRISIDNNRLSLAYFWYNNCCIVLYTTVPENYYETLQFLNTSYSEHKKQEFLKPYFQAGIGLALILMFLSIIGVAILLSILISQTITKPILELVNAAQKIAKGDFSVHLTRNEKDELALLYDSFNQMAKQLEHGRRMMYQTQKLQAWSEIARKLIHEIKNPLTPIRLSAERLYRRYQENHPNFSEIIKDSTKVIVDEVDILMNMLSEFSKFARLPEVNPQIDNVNDIIEKCVSMYVDNTTVTFTLQLASDFPLVRCDRSLLRQAFMNIIQNSIDAKATQITIITRRNDTDGMLQIIFADNGEGISAENIDKIFEPTFSTKEHGMGLGLAIVEKIIIDHGWDISCNSVPNKGTEFIIIIPYEKM